MIYKMSNLTQESIVCLAFPWNKVTLGYFNHDYNHSIATIGI